MAEATTNGTTEPAKPKKEKAAPAAPPDGTKPIELMYFYARQNFGATPNNLLVSAKYNNGNGSSFADGNGVSGICDEIVLYPGGFVVAKIRHGTAIEPKFDYVAVTGGGNGKVAT